jgi:hypothetical protein
MYTAWYFLSIEDLKHYIMFMLFIFLHWYILNGKCLLTVLEYQLLDKKIINMGYENAPFYKELFSNYGIDIDEKIIASFMYFIIIILILLAICRLNFTKTNIT